MLIYLPFLVCLIGLILYLAAKPPSELRPLALAMFWTGLLVTLFQVAGSTASILK